MKISVFYEHVRDAAASRGCALTDLFPALREWGIDGIDFPAFYFEANRELLQKALRDNELCVSGLYENVNWSRGVPAGEIDRLLKIAQDAEVDTLLVVPGFVDEADAAALQGASAKDCADWMQANEAVCSIAAGMAEIARKGKARGIAVALEDYDGLRAPYARLHQLEWFMKRIPELCFNLDTGNFAFSDEDVMPAAEKLSDRISHVHLKDRGMDTKRMPGAFNKGLLPCAVGDGYMPIASAVHMLESSGYEGWYVIEHFGMPDQAQAIARSAAYLRSL